MERAGFEFRRYRSNEVTEFVFVRGGVRVRVSVRRRHLPRANRAKTELDHR